MHQSNAIVERGRHAGHAHSTFDVHREFIVWWTHFVDSFLWYYVVQLHQTTNARVFFPCHNFMYLRQTQGTKAFWISAPDPCMQLVFQLEMKHHKTMSDLGTLFLFLSVNPVRVQGSDPKNFLLMINDQCLSRLHENSKKKWPDTKHSECRERERERVLSLIR